MGAGPIPYLVVPADLKWAEVASLPTGAKIALIEGPLNEAVPFTFRLKFPANYKLPANWHPAIEHVTVISAPSTWGRETSLIRKRPRR